MTDFEFREMLIENERDTIALSVRYDELHAEDALEHEHEPIGECVFCGAEIFADDADYIINDEEQLGICLCCMNKCHWRE